MRSLFCRPLGNVYPSFDMVQKCDLRSNLDLAPHDLAAYVLKQILLYDGKGSTG